LRPGTTTAAAAVLAFLASSSPGRPQTPTFPSGVELVRIDVVVLDKEGRPVAGLTAADFEVSDEGKPVEIVSFEPVVVRSAAKPPTASSEPARISEPVAPDPEENRHFLVFFDDVNLGPVSVAQLRAQLAPFLERETHEGDSVTIVSPAAGLKWTARTAFERRQIPDVIDSLRARLFRNSVANPMSDFAAMEIVEFGGMQRELTVPDRNARFTPSASLNAADVYFAALRRVHQTLGGLLEALQSLISLPGRKSLVLYSEGFLKSPDRMVARELDQVVDLARRARVTIYWIDPRGLVSYRAMADGPSQLPEAQTPSTDAGTDGGSGGGASYIVRGTGGRVSASNDTTALFHEALVESTTSYLVGFQPPAGAAGERQLKVRTRREGLKVRAPDRYFAGQAPLADRLAPAAIQALAQVADAGDIPLRVATLFLDSTASDLPATTLAVELPLPPGAPEETERELTLLVEARSLVKGDTVRDTADVTLPPSNRPGVATRELHLHPGIWQARVVVRDPATEKLGSVLHTFEVPEAKGLRVSSPILSNRLERSRVPRAELRLDRRYKPSDALYCQYQVFGATPDAATHAPRVSGSYAILRDGQPLQEGPATPIEPNEDGTLQRLIGFGLADYQPGDYTLVLRVKDQLTGTSREIREPFSVGDSGMKSGS
jgi:VWFA-related protein